MANITETATYDAAVPQLELTTAATGGAGGSMNSQAQALANRTKYLKDAIDAMGNVVSRDIGTTPGTVAAGDAPAAAQAAAESTAALALAGHVSDADPHTQYQKEADALALGELSSTAYRGDYGKVAYDKAQEIITAAEITTAPSHLWALVAGVWKKLKWAEGLAAIVAGVKATAANIVTGTSDLILITVKGLKDSLALADMWLTKRTKMPDGATPDYTTAEKWASSADGWASSYYTPSYPGDNVMRLTCPAGLGAFDFYKNFSALGVDGKQLLVSIRCTKAVTITLKNTSGIIGTMDLTPNVFTHKLFLLPVGVATLNFYRTATDIMEAGDYYDFQFVVIGSAAAVSYAVGSLSEEAARVWSEAADAPGTPRAAQGTLNIVLGNNASPGNYFDVGGARYTFRADVASLTTEGDVLIGLNSIASSTNLAFAIRRNIPASYDKSIGGSSPVYYCASPNALCYASGNTPTDGNTLLTHTATPGANNPKTGEIGNQIAIAKSGTNLSVSSPTLTGGCSAGAAKLSWLVARGSQDLDAKTSVAAGDYITILDSVFGFLKKKILASQFFAADGGTGPYTAVQGNDLRLNKLATWTPVIQGDGTAGVYELASSLVWSSRNGGEITVYGRLTLAASITGGGTGYIRITGIPVAKATGTNAIGRLIVSGLARTGVLFMGFASDGAVNTIYPKIDNNGTVGYIAVSGVAANQIWEFQITYRV